MRPLSWLKNSIPYLWARHAPEQPRAASPVSHLSAVIRGQTKGVNGALQLDPAKNLMLLESLSSLVRVLFESYSSLVRVGRVLFEFGRVMSSSAQLSSARLSSSRAARADSSAVRNCGFASSNAKFICLAARTKDASRDFLRSSPARVVIFHERFPAHLRAASCELRAEASSERVAGNLYQS